MHKKVEINFAKLTKMHSFTKKTSIFEKICYNCITYRSARVRCGQIRKNLKGGCKMKKFALKRTFAVLLVFAMVLSMLPAISLGTSAANVEATVSSEIPVDVPSVIYNANGSAILGYDIVSGSAIGKSATATEEGKLPVPDGSAAVVVKSADNGSYYLTIGKKYLSINSSEALSLEDEPKNSSSLSSRWEITKDTSLGGYQISSADVQYSGGPVYIEYFSSKGFCGWTYKETDAALYAFDFYKLPDGADEDGDGYIGTRPVSGELPEADSTVVIYNNYAKSIIGPMTSETASSMEPIESKVSNGAIEPGDGGLIFTVGKDGEYYTFKNGDRYLAIDPGESGQGEELYLKDTLDDYAEWTLEEMNGGFGIYNKKATYNGKAVCIEYFGDKFSGWTFNNASYDYFVFNFFKVTDTKDHMTSNPTLTIDGLSPALGKDATAKIVVSDHKEISSISATYYFDGANEGTTVTPEATETAKTYTLTIPKADLVGHSSLSLRVTSTNASGETATGNVSADIVDEPLIVSYSPAAASGTGSDKRPTITVEFANAGTDPTISMTINDNAVTPSVSGEKITYAFQTDQPDGKVVVHVTVTRKDGKSANAEWSFYIGEAGLGLYFGQMHSHTSEYSDGAGTLEDAYEHASKAPDVDFLFVTDHSNYFDTKDTSTPDSIYEAGHSAITMSDTYKDGVQLNKWQEAKYTAEQYTTDDFIALYGYEMTWSGGPGHINTFNSVGIVSRNNSDLNNKTNYGGMFMYFDLMVDANSKGTYTGEGQISSMFNHPGTTFGTFGDFTGYTPARDQIMNLVEVGNGEGQVGGSSYFPSYEHYDNALAMGWHLAPSNNQDNHKGNWGDANTCRDVVITDNFSEQGIYDAIAARHVYATEDQNLNILYYLKADANGDGKIDENESYLQGDIISTEPGVTVDKVTINVSFREPDGDALGRIDVIGEGGKSVWHTDVTGSSYEMNEELDNTDAYYYIKVTKPDGKLAVTAPVWVGESLPILFTGITNTNALSVTGEADTITTTLTNSSTEELKVNSLTYTVDEKEYYVDKDVAGTTVAAGATVDYTMTYTPATEGSHVITANLKGTVPSLGDEEVDISISLTIRSYDASSLVNIAIDRGHTNYYVSGDYTDSAKNFVTFCAQNGVRANYIEAGEFNYDTLSKYKLVVLTVPYMRNTSAATMYTDAEIAELAKYTEAGGNVIICSKSDRDNTYDNCAENSNKLLEAIGAHTRVVDGIIVDNDLKANEAYRLYLSSIDNFNTEHRFTKGAYTSSDAFGTTPSADNQTGFQLYNGAPLQVLDDSKVDVLVRGYDSTWGSHYDNYFTSASFEPVYDGTEEHVTVEKGKVNVMTYEDLPGGGWVVASGVTFFSDFDIKDGVNYANSYIAKNILDDLTGANENVKLTDIAEVKSQPDDGTLPQFTIEGYVTANASGYDQNTAFFDCIYVQDTTGHGINVFPVAGSFAIGMHVRVHGAVTYYCGEVELNISDIYNGYITILDDNLNKLAPKAVTAKQAMADENIGLLMSVTGTISSVHRTEGVVDKIYVDDGSGVDACVFINGYILNSADNYSEGFIDANGKAIEPAVGMSVTAVGIGSRDVDETSADNTIFARLRVRDRAEIKLSGEPDYAYMFEDVHKGDWFYKAVSFVAEHDLMVGVTNTTFAPYQDLTRGMAVTILYRLDGRPPVNGLVNPFTDVASGRYYTKAVRWGYSTGVVAGTTTTTFQPNRSVSREEMAAFLYRYAEYKGYDTKTRGNLAGFPDASDISNYAVENMRWAVGIGIISGSKFPSTGKILLLPKGTATRGQFASMIMRFVSKMNPAYVCNGNHTFVLDEGSSVAATCTEPGTGVYVCSVCGEKETRTIAALGHDFGTEGVVTKEPTCTQPGERTYKCSRCDATQTEEIPATGHVDEDKDGICDVCGEKIGSEVPPVGGSDYTLATELKDGDEVIIYNASAGKAMSETDESGYRAGTDVTVTDNKITTDDTKIVWTVEATADGFKLKNDAGDTLSCTTALSFADTDNVWMLTTAATANSVYIQNTTAKGTSGDPKTLEWYSDKNNFSTYYVGSGDEALFAMQLYVKGAGGTAPDPEQPPVESDATFVKVTEDPTDWSGEYLIVAEGVGGKNYAFNGGNADGLDKAGNGVEVAITDNKIEATEANLGMTFTVASYDNGYSILSKDGTYLGHTTGSNFTTDQTAFTFTFENGKVKMAHDDRWIEWAHSLTEGTGRFRMYKVEDGTADDYNTYYVPALYKLTTNGGGGTPEPGPEHVHDYEYTVTVAPTLTTAGELTGTCKSTVGECNAKTVTVVLPILNEEDYTKSLSEDGLTATYTWNNTEYGNFSFDVSVGGQEPEGDVYALVKDYKLKDGDKIIIYNPDAKKAVSEDVYSTSNLAGVDVIPVENKITTNNTKIVWEVTGVSGDTFRLKYDDDQQLTGAFQSLTPGSAGSDWQLVTATTQDCFYIHNPSVTGSQGDPLGIEWYNGDFTAYWHADGQNETAFAMQIYLYQEPTAPAQKKFEKVTADPADAGWEGKYLLVYESSDTAGEYFRGSLSDTSLSNESNHKTVTIENSTIAWSQELEGEVVTLAKKDTGYTIQTTGGVYFNYSDGQKNGFTATATEGDAVVYSLTLDGENNVDITTVTESGPHLRWNPSSPRFAFYKAETYTSQQPITLYKLVEG